MVIRPSTRLAADEFSYGRQMFASGREITLGYRAIHSLVRCEKHEEIDGDHGDADESHGMDMQAGSRTTTPQTHGKKRAKVFDHKGSRSGGSSKLAATGRSAM